MILRGNHFALFTSHLLLALLMPPKAAIISGPLTLVKPLYYRDHNKQVVETLKWFLETNSTAIWSFRAIVSFRYTIQGSQVISAEALQNDFPSLRPLFVGLDATI